MNGLDLFSGIGGLSLALRSWVRTVAYCERDRYAQAVLLSRMASNELDRAPIWDDVTSLRGTMLPSIDIIFGGFPCQDISVAGAGRGLGGERSGLYAHIERLVEETKPSFVFLENVPAIRTRGLGRVVWGLSSLGYDLRWTVISAASVGAPHKRDRWFLLAYADKSKLREQQGWGSGSDWEREIQSGYNGTKESLADANVERLQGRMGRWGQESIIAKTANNHWWSVEPDVGRKFNGTTRWMDRNGGGNFADEIEKGAYQVLRDLQCSYGAETLQRETRGLECIFAEETLLAFVRQYENDHWGAWEILESETPSEECLRALRIESNASSSSLRRGPIEQYFREYPNALRELSLVVASRGETPWSNPLWESALPRITNELPLRVDRIKCLGNAVVPLQAKTAFQILTGIRG